jgi:hypothetical protein
VNVEAAVHGWAGVIGESTVNVEAAGSHGGRAEAAAVHDAEVTTVGIPAVKAAAAVHD